MAVSSAIVAVSTTPALLSADSDGGGASVLVQAPASATLFVGGSTVTPATGFAVAAGQALSVDLPGPNDQLFGVLASGSGVVSVLRSGA